MAEAYEEWIRNECATDDVGYYILAHDSKMPARDRILTGRIRKALPALEKKPGLLQGVLDEIEQMHPWPRALASAMSEAVDRLL